jgi:transposase-like protein
MDTSRQVPTAIADKSESLGAVPRQRRSIAEKRRILEETLVPGASVAKVARAHGVNANQVFGWRRLYLAGRLGEQKPGIKLLPVRRGKCDHALYCLPRRRAFRLRSFAAGYNWVLAIGKQFGMG